MNHPPDQHIIPGAPALPQAAPPVTAYYPPAGPSTPARPSAWLVFRKTVRLLLRRLLYNLVRVLRPMRPFAGFIALILALLGVIGWLSIALWSVSTADGSDTRAALLPPSAALSNYIRGQQRYDATLMWDALSPETQASRLEQGASKTTMQATANAERSSGLRYTRFTYVGGVPLENSSGSMHFYAVGIEFRQQRATLPYSYVVDADGKVLSVRTPFDQN